MRSRTRTRLSIGVGATVLQVCGVLAARGGSHVVTRAVQGIAQPHSPVQTVHLGLGVKSEYHAGLFESLAADPGHRQVFRSFAGSLVRPLQTAFCRYKAQWTESTAGHVLGRHPTPASFCNLEGTSLPLRFAMLRDGSPAPGRNRAAPRYLARPRELDSGARELRLELHRVFIALRQRLRACA